MLKHIVMGIPFNRDLGKNVYTAEDIQIGVIEHRKCRVKQTPQIVQTLKDKDIMRVTGKIVDDMGEGIPSAHIFNATKNSGDISDSNGVFALEADPNDDIEVSFVGFKTVKTKAKNLGKTIQMMLDTQVLPEVIVRPEHKKCPLLCWLKKNKDMVMIGIGVTSVLLTVYAVAKHKR